MSNIELANSFVGKRVRVVRNSERTIFASMLGENGTVTQTVAGDCKVEFDNGRSACIIASDLEEI